jgi:hypothetical protein
VKLRHAAALALVGWYLMIPPAVVEHGNHRIYTKAAPLSRWSLFQSFDTAKDCQKAATALRQGVVSALSANPKQPLDNLRPMYAICIATDDPRLKGN